MYQFSTYKHTLAHINKKKKKKKALDVFHILTSHNTMVNLKNMRFFSAICFLCAVVCGTSSKCEEISSWICKNVKYNLTSFPNEMNHNSQKEAHLDVIRYSLLLNTKCSSILQLFICSVYMPICMTNYHIPLKPCRSICEKSKIDCAPSSEVLNFKWPKEMLCDRFPDEMDDEKCLKSDSFEKNSDIQIFNSYLVYNKNVTKFKSIEKFSVSCAVFSSEIRKAIRFSITIWSAVCSICSIIVLIIFIKKNKHSKFPLKSIKYLTFCSMNVAIGYFLGNENVKYASTGPTSCTMIFCMQYFFGIASSIWCMILSFTWFLAAGLKWSNESIEIYSSYFHCIAWIIPSIQTVSVLWLGSIDADPVAGICSVGNFNMENLKIFVMVPSMIYFIVNVSFLFAGCIFLRFGKSIMCKSTSDNIISACIFDILFTVPWSIVLGCQIYEIYWMENVTTCPHIGKQYRDSGPILTLFLMKYFMTLAFGMIVAVYIWISIRCTMWKPLLLQAVAYNRINTHFNEASELI